MKTKLNRQSSGWARALCAAGLAWCGLGVGVSNAQTIAQWGLTVTNINNPIPPIVATNSDGSVSITAGGGDTYGSPDSFTYAYQQVTGDFDIKVRIINVTATDPQGQDSPKASLMVRASLDPGSYDYMINALPLAPSGRDGQIESIGRLDLTKDTDDLPGKGVNYGGDTTDHGYCTYPDVWLRIQRQGDKFTSYFATTNTTDYPSGASPMSTNGWQLLTVIPAGSDFGPTVYVGLSTVAHNSDLNSTNTVTSTYAAYGPTGFQPSIPSSGGVAVPATNLPGAFPISTVLAVNWEVSLPTNGLGYPGNVIQSQQGPAQPILWHTGGYASVSRDIIAGVDGESPEGFSSARYQDTGFDFMISPQKPTVALENMGPYSNPLRERYGSGDPTVPASEAWAPSPNYGFAMITVRKNGASWDDGTGPFYANAYLQLDGVATGAGYDMIGGHFRGGQFYTRATKIVTGPLPSNYQGADLTQSGPFTGNLQRAAIPMSVAWFPYQQGWKAGYFDDSQSDSSNPGTPHWKHGDGWGLNSGTAVSGLTVQGGQSQYNNPAQLLTWLNTGLATLTLPGVNSVNDGFLLTVGNDENNGERGPSANNAALPDGSGWYVAVRDVETSAADPTVYASSGGDSGSSFSFLFVPWASQNLIGGHIKGDGSTIKGAGNYSIQKLSTGRYALSIPGKTDKDGALFVQNTGYLASQPAGYTNVVDNSFFSYEFGATNAPANTFVIESHAVVGAVTGVNEGQLVFRDGEFNFVWVDFNNPLTPPGYLPTLSIAKNQNGTVTLTWDSGTLQQASSLTGGFTPVAATSPYTVSASGALFFRAVK